MKKPSKGITLIEVLISLVIMSIGLLAVLKMEIYSIQATNSAYQTSIAIIRLNSLHALNAEKPDNFSELFSSWTAENKLYLPDAKTAYHNQTVSLSWYDNFTKRTIKIQTKV